MEQSASNANLRKPFDPIEAFGNWEKMRWIFNLSVGLVGIACIAIYAKRFGTQDIIELIGYGFVANLFYTMGFWAEMADQHFLRGKIGLYRWRIFIFLAGTFGSMLLTFLVTWSFYHYMIPHR